MDGAALLDRVRTDTETELNRLGSEKALLAATEARLETDAVLVTAAAALEDARSTTATWAEAATADVARETLQTTADRLANAHDDIAAELDDDDETAGIDDIVAVDVPFVALTADTDTERVGAATLGLALVLDRLFLQSVSFFVNEADNTRADRFRDLRGMTEEMLVDGQEALEALCEDEADWDAAAEGATATIEAAYADYVSRLDAMGFDPKPIC